MPVNVTATMGNLVLGGVGLPELLQEIKAIYLSDSRPWVIGYSGGKDSTTILQLVYTALLDLALEERHKPVFVVSSDTLVETPLVINLITGTLDRVNQTASALGLPISGIQVRPENDDTYWVNLLGRGYPAPTKQFRWCTERMKIDPVSNFIQKQVAKYGEVVVILGSRLDESTTRAQVMRRHKIEGQRLARHSSLPSAYVYTPIETWSTDDVWEYLFSGPAPWGGDHQALLDLYRDSNAGECPLVIDTSTPSCGSSRFGCWVCTVVTKDKSLEGLIASGQSWLKPLYEFRELLSETTKPENKNKYRNFKRRTGHVTAASEGSAHIPGPYLLWFRKTLLRRLLNVQKAMSDAGRSLQLITQEELHIIRQLWIQDPNEPDWEDSLPEIYREIFDVDLEWTEMDVGMFNRHDVELLRALGEQHGLPAELIMKLLELELSVDGLSKRAGLFGRIQHILNQEWDTLQAALEKQNRARRTLSVYEELETELQSIHEDALQ